MKLIEILFDLLLCIILLYSVTDDSSAPGRVAELT